MRPLTLQRLFLQCSLLAVVLFVVVVIALKLGAVPVSLYGLGRDLISVLLHQTKALTSDYGMIVIEIRLPRILLAIVVGAALSVAGTSYQALLRNPLAHPYVLGVSMGAALGAILALIAEPHLAPPVWLTTPLIPLAASILTGLAVSVSGAIGYVGLLVPHVMRLLFGSDHRILLPTAAFGGAIAVVIADTLARTVVAPSELPVGAMTALVGAPLFIYLLRRRIA